MERRRFLAALVALPAALVGVKPDPGADLYADYPPPIGYGGLRGLVDDGTYMHLRADIYARGRGRVLNEEILLKAAAAVRRRKAP